MMKIVKIPFLAAAVLVLISACEPEPVEQYFSTLGILKILEDSILIESDQDNILYISDKGSISSVFADSDRVVASFTLMDWDLPPGVDYVIDIYEIQKVYTATIIEFTEEGDTLGDDPIKVDGVWLAKDFMNLNFSYLGGQIAHGVNLVYYPDTTQNDTVVVEIMHNDFDDGGTVPLSSFVSFDLSPIQPADSVILRILSTGFNGNDFDKCLTYKNPD